MNPQQEISQRAWINELLHRMTVANTREVRVQLCAEVKQAIAEYMKSVGGPQ